jgi:hypothetical protein
VSLFKAIRVAILLLILLVVAGSQWLGAARLAAWDRPIWITVYPIPADGDPRTRAYISGLDPGGFDDIDSFIVREAGRYGIALPKAAHFQLAPVPASMPPTLPATDNRLAIGWWSLRMRWWAWRQAHQDGLLDPDIQVFMRYQTGEGVPQLDRSIGMQKGRYTLVNAFADRRLEARNRFVVAHELLHVLGATDKYDPASGQPLAPEGLADPRARPLYPQRRAEIMAGAVAVSPADARMPNSLRESVVGEQTAREIGWLE